MRLMLKSQGFLSSQKWLEIYIAPGDSQFLALKSEVDEGLVYLSSERVQEVSLKKKRVHEYTPFHSISAARLSAKKLLNQSGSSSSLRSRWNSSPVVNNPFPPNLNKFFASFLRSYKADNQSLQLTRLSYLIRKTFRWAKSALIKALFEMKRIAQPSY